MPFKSEKQRKYLYANEPKVAKEFANEEKKMEAVARSVASNKMADKPKKKPKNHNPGTKTDALIGALEGFISSWDRKHPYHKQLMTALAKFKGE